MVVNEKAMKALQSLDQVIEFLSDQLGWPVDASELEKSTFQYTPEELGVDSLVGERINSIRQIRPVTLDQPWGIFLLDLAGTNLTKKTIREVLKGLTAKRRAERQPGAWNKENLLFIVSSGKSQDFQIHFLSFKPLEDAKTEIRTLDWNPLKSPPQKIRRLSTDLLPLLTWPNGDFSAGSWLLSWGAAFKVPLGKTISDASSLAKRMAEVAIRLKDTMLTGLQKEQGKGPLNDLLRLIKAEIDSDADEQTFADMCAQTITYGLLAARVNDPEGFGSSPVFDSFSLNDEFLESLFAEVQEAISLPAEDTQSIEALSGDLISTNVEAILDEFGNSSDGGDPVIHFYEQFLFLYDREIRMSAGAFYTPKPVVDTMVRLVDDLLIEKFGLAKGFADESTWAQVCGFLGIDVPSDKDPRSRFLSILDPATGTGTYLVSVIERARENLVKTGMSEASARALMSDSLVPKLTAFELMLGPYSIANLKLGLAHHGENKAHPKTIFLTNTLDLNDDVGDLFTEPTALSREGQAAQERKLKEPFTVIIGNPPYAKDTQFTGPTRDLEDRMGGTMRHKSNFFKVPPIQDFLTELPLAGVAKNKAASVYNLYAFFWRWSMWQALQKNVATGPDEFQTLNTKSPGIVAFITASSFVHTASFAGMRGYLRQEFDELYVIDLGGSALSGVEDPNIFAIKTPVAICIGVRRTAFNQSKELAEVRYLRLEGSRSNKLSVLNGLNLNDLPVVAGTKYSSLAGTDMSRLSGLRNLADFFEVNSSALLPGRTWVSGPSKDALSKRWDTLLSASSDEEKSRCLKSNARTIYSSPIPFLELQGHNLTPLAELSPGSKPEGLIEYSYRPFDNQWLIADMRLIGQPSIFRKMRHSNQFWIGSGQTVTNGPSAVAYRYIPDYHAFYGFGGGKDYFPAFADPSEEIWNLGDLAKNWISKLDQEASNRDFVNYLYAIHGSGAFTEFYGEDLKLGTQRAKLPLTDDKELFYSLGSIGGFLLDCHLSDNPSSQSRAGIELFAANPKEIADSPVKITYDQKSQSIMFDKEVYCVLPEEIWNFSIGSLQVVKSWLANRKLEPKGKRTSPLDAINETKWTYNSDFRKLVSNVSAILESKKLVMPLLTKVVEEHESASK